MLTTGELPTATSVPLTTRGEYPRLYLLKKGLKSSETQQRHLPVVVVAPAEEVLVDAVMVSGEELTKESCMLAKETQP